MDWQPRDFQRSKAYAAEYSLRPSEKGWWELNMDVLVTRIQAIVDRHSDLRWPSMIEVQDGRRQRGAYAVLFSRRLGRLSIGRAERTANLVCHELAHLVVDDPYACHGPEWARVYLHMLSREHMPGAARLAQRFEEGGVQVAPPSVLDAFIAPTPPSTPTRVYRFENLPPDMDNLD